MVDVILLERVEKLGQMGQVVKVRPGFARNYLLPQKKALRATKQNMAYSPLPSSTQPSRLIGPYINFPECKSPHLIDRILYPPPGSDARFPQGF